MISEERMQALLNQGKELTITFVGLPFKNTKQASIHTFHGMFTMIKDRIITSCMTLYEKQYSRSIKKIICITQKGKLLYGKRCRSCGAAMPRRHGNCFSCYSTNYEQKY